MKRSISMKRSIPTKRPTPTEQRIVELIELQPGLSADDVAKQLDLTRAAVMKAGAKFGIAFAAQFGEVPDTYTEDDPAEVEKEDVVAFAKRYGERMIGVLVNIALARTIVRMPDGTLAYRPIKVTSTAMADAAGQVLDRAYGRPRQASEDFDQNADIVNSPVFMAIQAMLSERLAQYPEARHAVVQGLLELDKKPADRTPANMSEKPDVDPQKMN